MIEARKIMKESDQQLEELKVPVAGGYLNQLIKERKDLFYELMDSYYDLASQTQDMNTAKEKPRSLSQISRDGRCTTRRFGMADWLNPRKN